MIPPRLSVPLYSATLLLSAFLLFSVQPLLGKMILPLLGGAPAVWNTAMPRAIWISSRTPIRAG